MIYQIKQIRSKEEKKKIMAVCDDAFEKSIIGRSDYNALFNKVDSYAEFYVAYNSNYLGYVAMYANDKIGKTAYITLIGVRPCFQNNHIGHALLQTCIEEANIRKMQWIKLEVRDSNANAIRFYEKNGFQYQSRCSEYSFYMCKTL